MKEKKKEKEKKKSIYRQPVHQQNLYADLSIKGKKARIRNFAIMRIKSAVEILNNIGENDIFPSCSRELIVYAEVLNSIILPEIRKDEEWKNV